VFEPHKPEIILLSSDPTVCPCILINHIVLYMMSGPILATLAMSETKDALLKHVNLALETYTMMAVSLAYP
jgi:hypothetical protein